MIPKFCEGWRDAGTDRLRPIAMATNRAYSNWRSHLEDDERRYAELLEWAMAMSPFELRPFRFGDALPVAAVNVLHLVHGGVGVAGLLVRQAERGVMCPRSIHEREDAAGAAGVAEDFGGADDDG